MANKIISTDTICKVCHEPFSVKYSPSFITIMCKCGVLILYQNRNVRFVSHEEYKKFTKNAETIIS